MGEDWAMEVKEKNTTNSFGGSFGGSYSLFYYLPFFFSLSFLFLYIVHIIIVTDEIMMRSRETEQKWSMEHNTVMMHYLWCT